jgi:hypothetical protein
VQRREIIAAQSSDEGVTYIKRRLTKGDPRVNCFRVDKEGTLWFKDHLVVPKNHELCKKIFDEAHTSKYSIHPSSKDVSCFEGTILVDPYEARDYSLGCVMRHVSKGQG